MSFAQKLIRWQRRHGRRGLPWQGTRDPYRVWLSEVMLQQTQVGTVIPYYEKFLRKYPTVERLAAASEEDVLQLWSGLGYYARGRNLRAAAQLVSSRGSFPKTAAEIAELPGVGRSTAAAIAVFASGERAAILDANVKRVLARCFGLPTEEEQWRKAERLLPAKNVETYTQALMDLGATVCTRTPDCAACPVKARCVARRTGRIAELPAKRPRKALPLKRTNWFVYLDNGKVLLERRPSPGIWGGLWCFPEKALFRSKPAKRLAAIDHAFTHFRLQIQPLLVEAKSGDTAAGFWLEVPDAIAAAVPAPVRTLLQDLRSASPGAHGRRRARAAPASSRAAAAAARRGAR